MAVKVAGVTEPIALLATKALNAAYEMSMVEGGHFERHLNRSCWAISDPRESMQAFLDKRTTDLIRR